MNKKLLPIPLFLLAVIVLGVMLPFSRPVEAQTATETATVTATATATATPTRGILATASREPAASAERPVVVIESY